MSEQYDRDNSSSGRSGNFQISIDDDKLDEVLNSADEFDESLLEDTDVENTGSIKRTPPPRRPRPDGERRRPSGTPPSRRPDNRVSNDRAPKKKKPKKKNGCLYKMIYFIVICIVAVIISQTLIAGINDMLGVNKGEKKCTIIVPENASIDDVSALLKEAGLIQEEWFYKLYSDMTHAKYRFGTYQLDTSMDYQALNTYMATNLKRTDIVKVTFPEGYSVEQIAKRLEENKVCSADAFIAAVKTTTIKNDYVNEIDNADERYYRLEGYLFPDTYQFYLSEDPETVVKKFIDEGFRVRITAEIIEKGKELDMSVDDILTLASIIQKEASKPDDMKMISGCFHNRLKSKDNQWLGSDVTYWYPYPNREAVPAALLEGEFKEGSRYNTYKLKGLPPGPICNPGLDAIRAAINPANTDYQYFVNDANGKFYYARTKSKHDENVSYAESVKKKDTSSEEDNLIDEMNP